MASLALISAVQHLSFIVAAPALFLPLGIVLLRSSVLPRLFGYLALLLGIVFAILGITFLLRLRLPGGVTAFAGVQAGLVARRRYHPHSSKRKTSWRRIKSGLLLKDQNGYSLEAACEAFGVD